MTCGVAGLRDKPPSRGPREASNLRTTDECTPGLGPEMSDVAFDPGDPATFPPVLTVGEAARVLRISRSAAYVLVREHLASNGESGLPALRLGGRSLRVTRAAILELVGLGQHVGQ